MLKWGIFRYVGLNEIYHWNYLHLFTFYSSWWLRFQCVISVVVFDKWWMLRREEEIFYCWGSGGESRLVAYWRMTGSCLKLQWPKAFAAKSDRRVQGIVSVTPAAFVSIWKWRKSLCVKWQVVQSIAYTLLTAERIRCEAHFKPGSR